MGERKYIPGRATDCVGFALCPHACVGFLLVPWFPPTSQRCAWEVSWCVPIVPIWVSVGVSGPAMEGRPVWGGSYLVP